MEIKFDEIFELVDIIEYQEKIYDILKNIKFSDNNNKNMLKLIAGLGISNSIYEKFSKTILTLYCNKKSYSYKNKCEIISKNKSLINIAKMLKTLELNLENQYNLHKNYDDTLKSTLNYSSLISQFIDSYEKRNLFLHGDFDLNHKITIDFFENFVLNTLKLQSSTLTIIKDTFINNLKNI